MLLSNENLFDLTGYKQPAAQIRALRTMGITFHTRPDGRPVVTWEGVNGQKNQSFEPDFAAMRKNG